MVITYTLYNGRLHFVIGLDLGHDPVGCFFVCDVVDGDVAAFRGEFQCD